MTYVPMVTATVSMPASGMENENTLISANNYASFLIFLKRFEEATATVSMPARGSLGGAATSALLFLYF